MSFANTLTKLLIQEPTKSPKLTQDFRFLSNDGDGRIIDKDRLINLSFDKLENRLSFKIQHYHAEPKISRYVQRNYQRFPVYEGEYLERTRIVKNFNKIINSVKFVNEDILKLDLEKKFIWKIIDEIGIIPPWREKEIAIEKIENQIVLSKRGTRNFQKEQESYRYKTTNLEEKASNFWIRLILSPITLGLSFLVNYTSKTEARRNAINNAENSNWNFSHKVEIDKINKNLAEKIGEHNKKINDHIHILLGKVDYIKSQKVEYEKKFEDGWFDLKDASNTYYSKLSNKKGVYIIWNKSKNKYYVGQSKNIKNRLLNHFKDGEPKNIIFAKDWFAGDYFVYKYFFCQTKDELDALEKRYIDEYLAFENGYNKTRGNI